ncbi:hypothetical protein CPC16_002155 [Podila verticillata]|nr:hypothetical protein CPC16_002155 [Podila verticillata]
MSNLALFADAASTFDFNFKPSNTPMEFNADIDAADTSAKMYQYFRSNGELIRIQATQNPITGQYYIFWSDLRACFPNMIRIQHHDTVATFLRCPREYRLRPLRIAYVPDAVLDVVYEDKQNGPNGSAQHTSSRPPKANTDELWIEAQGKETNSQSGGVVVQELLPNEEYRRHVTSGPSDIETLEPLDEKVEEKLSQFIASLSNGNKGSKGDPVDRLSHIDLISRYMAEIQDEEAKIAQLEKIMDKFTRLSSPTTDTHGALVKASEGASTKATPINGISPGTSAKDAPAMTPPQLPETRSEPVLTNDLAKGTKLEAPKKEHEDNAKSSKEVGNQTSKSSEVERRDNETTSKEIEIEAKEPKSPEEIENEIKELNEFKFNFEIAKDGLVNTTHLFQAFIQASAKGHLTIADKIGLQLNRQLEDLETKLEMGSQLRPQFAQLCRALADTQRSLQQIREPLIQNRIYVILSQKLAMLEHTYPRVFVILPVSDDPSSTEYRIHFLCECQDYPDVPNSSGIPRHLHLTDSEGYEIQDPTKLIQVFGSYILDFLNMLKYGVNFEGSIIPPLEPGSLLSRVNKAMEHIMETGEFDLDDTRPLISGLYEFLKPEDRCKPSLGFHRFVLEEGFLFWMCKEHFNELGFQPALARFFEACEQCTGYYKDESLGLAHILIRQRAQAEKVYAALELLPAVFDLGLILDWRMTVKDFDRLLQVLQKSRNPSIRILFAERKDATDAENQSPEALIAFVLKNVCFQRFQLGEFTPQLRQFDIPTQLSLLRRPLDLSDWQRDSLSMVTICRDRHKLASISRYHQPIARALEWIKKQMGQDFDCLDRLSLDSDNEEALIDFNNGEITAMDLRAPSPTSNYLLLSSQIKNLRVSVSENQGFQNLCRIISRNKGLTTLDITCTEQNMAGLFNLTWRLANEHPTLGMVRLRLENKVLVWFEARHMDEEHDLPKWIFTGMKDISPVMELRVKQPPKEEEGSTKEPKKSNTLCPTQSETSDQQPPPTQPETTTAQSLVAKKDTRFRSLNFHVHFLDNPSMTKFHTSQENDSASETSTIDFSRIDIKLWRDASAVHYRQIKESRVFERFLVGKSHCSIQGDTNALLDCMKGIHSEIFDGLKSLEFMTLTLDPDVEDTPETDLVKAVSTNKYVVSSRALSEEVQPCCRAYEVDAEPVVLDAKGFQGLLHMVSEVAFERLTFRNMKLKPPMCEQLVAKFDLTKLVSIAMDIGLESKHLDRFFKRIPDPASSLLKEIRITLSDGMEYVLER